MKWSILHQKGRYRFMQAYCVKCRAKKEMKDAKAITMKNGKPATQGVCPTCGTKMFRIGKS
jgi:NAD-dependent SIR2 family protein deacetylase